MARVLALSADLLFGSRLLASLTAAGHEVELVAGAAELREALAQAHAQALIVDLTDDRFDGAQTVKALARELSQTRILAYYSHVDPAARELALQAGVELAVPRSRMAREARELVAGLLSTER